MDINTLPERTTDPLHLIPYPTMKPRSLVGTNSVTIVQAISPDFVVRSQADPVWNRPVLLHLFAKGNFSTKSLVRRLPPPRDTHSKATTYIKEGQQGQTASLEQVVTREVTDAMLKCVQGHININDHRCNRVLIY